MPFVPRWLVRACFCASFFVGGTTVTHAGPMGFVDSWMVMGDFDPKSRELWVNYAFTPRDAVGAELGYMRSDDKTRSRDLGGLTYTRLVHRWHLPHAQANVYALVGAGTLRRSEQTGESAYIAPGVQLDYETTRVYLGGTARTYRASGLRHDHLSVRAGFSFTEAEYEETQPWFIVEAKRMRGLSEKTEITPMLRFINKGYFVEIGMSTDKQLRFNFMYVY